MVRSERSRSPHRQEASGTQRPIFESRIVELNVGGVHYTTSKETLCMRPSSMLASMFSGNIPSHRDEHGRVFIDRDGPMFRHVLNHLRGYVSLPTSGFDLSLLCEEASFYNLPALEEAARAALIAVNPYELPEEFEWYHCDINEDIDAQEIADLLENNYVEDADNMFRFNISVSFLRWHLGSPGSQSRHCLGIRLKRTGRLVAFCAFLRRSLRVHQQQFNAVEISYLCLDRQYRGQRLFRVLVQEMARCVNLHGLQHAVYRTGALLRRKERRQLISSSPIHHRALDFAKLVNVDFAVLPVGMTLAQAIRFYSLPDRLQVAGIRKMQESDVTQVCELVSAHTKSFAMHFDMDAEEVGHHLLPREAIVYSLVREVHGRVTDLCSFYSVQSTIIDHPEHDFLYCATLSLVIAKEVSLQELLQDALIYAKSEGFDVFNVENTQNMTAIFEELKFVPGDGSLHVYTHNVKCQPLQPSQILLWTPS